MREIILAGGGFAQVSDEDWLWLIAYSWSDNGDGYPQARVDSKVQRMHKLVAAKIGILGRVDHKDRNKANNQRENLRAATQSQNIANSSLRKDSVSGFKGVTWAAREQKWKAEIKVNGKSKFLGYFDEPAEGGAAYSRAAKQYFGEFANG